MAIQIQLSKIFMFSHLNDMFVNKSKHPHLREFISLQHPSRYMEFHANLGFDGTMCTMGSYVCKQGNLHVTKNKVLHSTFVHKRTLLMGTNTQVLTLSLSCSHFNDIFRASVDALCRDGAGQISREHVQRGRLTRRGTTS